MVSTHSSAASYPSSTLSPSLWIARQHPSSRRRWAINNQLAMLTAGRAWPVTVRDDGTSPWH
eukprot:2126666-Alexandrium_andersonii.AAC.1